MTRRNRVLISLAIFAFALTACGGGGGSTLPSGGGTPVPIVSPTVTPTSTPTVAPQSVTCPTTGSSPSGYATSTGAESLSRRMSRAASVQGYVPGTIAVTYSSSAPTAKIDSIESNVRGQRTAQLQFSALGLRTRIIAVDPSRTADVIAQLKSVPGVRSVGQASYRRKTAVTSNDPYYAGFGAGAPYFQDNASAGQWDMHVINVEGAWNQVYSTSSIPTAPIAVVDTGVDVTHPELTGGKIIRTECFVTYPASAAQTHTSYVTDTDGHGTNVAGIADGDTNNNLGFAGVGFSEPLMGYRIFPSDPSGGCEGSKSNQCSADTADEAAAINDAVNNGAKVINLSLGGGTTPCDATDPEYTAVENAIAHNVVVVAAAGNGNSSGVGLSSLTCPAGDPGVIAVGATTLDDSATPIVERVSSYSNYVSGTNSGHFVVAPGGDPTSVDQTGSTTDYLHWIEHIYSSTAAQAGNCKPDLNSTSGIGDCRVLIAGTSQATPHVAGIASLILSVKPAYTPAQVAAAICNSADNINDAKQGCGRVNASAAVTYALNH